MYQANNSMLPDNIQNIFNKNCNAHHHFTKWKLVERKQGLLLLVFLVLKLWNDFPANFHSFQSLMAFKRSPKYKYMYVEDYISII